MSFPFVPSLLKEELCDLDALFHLDSPMPFDREWVTRSIIWIEESKDPAYLREKELSLGKSSRYSKRRTSASKDQQEITTTPNIPTHTTAIDKSLKLSILTVVPQDVGIEIFENHTKTTEALESPAAAAAAAAASSSSSSSKSRNYVTAKLFLQPMGRSRHMWDELLQDWVSPDPQTLPTIPDGFHSSDRSGRHGEMYKIYLHPHPNTCDYSLEDPSTGATYESKIAVPNPEDYSRLEIIRKGNSHKIIKDPLLVPLKHPHRLNMAIATSFSNVGFHVFSFEYLKYQWHFSERLHLNRADSLDKYATATAVFIGTSSSTMTLDQVRASGNPYICIHARRYMTEAQYQKLFNCPVFEEVPMFIRMAPDFMEIQCIEVSVKYQLLSERLLDKTCKAILTSLYNGIYDDVTPNVF